MNIAIIPARGGSKRIPKKNIKEFCGKPMIAWSIELAISSELFDDVIVSTDDDDIADVAKLYGAKVPFKRPVHLSDDLTPTVPVIAHAIGEHLLTDTTIKFVCCIYPCSPFILINDLEASIKIMKERGANFIYPVCEYHHPIYRGLRKLKNDKMEFLYPEFELTRTQDLEKVYHDTGQFYWGKVNAWLDNMKMHSNGLGFTIPNWRVVDIDNIDDWKRAELLFKQLNRN
jgi:pseudaminic acid cytidylyltransferase